MPQIRLNAYIAQRKIEGRTIFVYGEMAERPYVTAVAPVTVTPKGHIVREVFEPIMYLNGTTRSPRRYFNMGWAICLDSDEFDPMVGVKIARRRFSDSALETSNGRWLNDDMCAALVRNEANYIAKNLDKFVNKYKHNVDKEDLPVVEDDDEEVEYDNIEETI